MTGKNYRISVILVDRRHFTTFTTWSAINPTEPVGPPGVGPDGFVGPGEWGHEQREVVINGVKIAFEPWRKVTVTDAAFEEGPRQIDDLRAEPACTPQPKGLTSMEVEIWLEVGAEPPVPDGSDPWFVATLRGRFRQHGNYASGGIGHFTGKGMTWTPDTSNPTVTWDAINCRCDISFHGMPKP
jgi:hypothetical protein